MFSYRKIVWFSLCVGAASGYAQPVDRVSWNCMRKQLSACELGAKTSAFVKVKLRQYSALSTVTHTSATFDPEEISAVEVTIEKIYSDKTASLTPRNLKLWVSGPISKSGWSGDGDLTLAREHSGFMVLTKDGERWILRMHGFFWWTAGNSFHNEGGLSLSENDLIAGVTQGIGGSCEP
jgi:hypothetical protein